MNLLITGAWQNAKQYIDQIEEWGHNVIFMQHENEQMPCDYRWIEGVIGNGIFLYHPIERFENLRYIQLTSAGCDRVPMDYVREKKITIKNARGVYGIPMAEFVVGYVLQFYKKMSFFRENQKKHEWEKNRELEELYGKKVCIVGCGNVGTECAKRFKAFGCEVVGVDLLPQDNCFYDSMTTLDTLDSVLKEIDVLVLTLPLTNDTYHMIDEHRLALLKKNAIVINISRGAIIDSEALSEMLPHIGGAILDVFEDEPLEKESNLWDMENVIITPHNSFVGDGNSKRLDSLILTGVKK